MSKFLKRTARAAARILRDRWFLFLAAAVSLSAVAAHTPSAAICGAGVILVALAGEAVIVAVLERAKTRRAE